MIAQEEIGSYLTRLASREPTPGGGAAGGLHLAQGAALLAMVARYSTGKNFQDVQERAELIAAQADDLISRSVKMADEDEEVFAAVIGSYQLPRLDDAQKVARTEAIQKATVDATGPQLDTVKIAGSIIELASELAGIGNRNVLSDVAAAAESARAALGTAVVTLEINIKSLSDQETRNQLTQAVNAAESGMKRAEEISLRVRQVFSQ